METLIRMLFKDICELVIDFSQHLLFIIIIVSVLCGGSGNSSDKLRRTRSVAYSVELVVLNKHQISDGGAYLDCYPKSFICNEMMLSNKH